MPRHVTSTSFVKGDSRLSKGSEQRLKQAETLRKLGRHPSNPWTEESKNRLRSTITKKMLGQVRLVYRTGIPYFIERTKNGWKYQHRVVMEKALGRKLDRSEIVHHINHDSLDNRIENLQLTNNSEHNLLHAPYRDVSHLIAASKAKKLNGRWSLKFDSCIQCTRTSVRHAARGFCRVCYNKVMGYIK